MTLLDLSTGFSPDLCSSPALSTTCARLRGFRRSLEAYETPRTTPTRGFISVAEFQEGMISTFVESIVDNLRKRS